MANAPQHQWLSVAAKAAAWHQHGINSKQISVTWRQRSM